MLWHSPYFKRAMTFRMRGRYEKTEEGYQIRYRFLPTLTTLLWVGIPMALLWYYVLWDIRSGGEGALPVALFSAMYPLTALWQYFSCHKAMQLFFRIPTQ